MRLGITGGVAEGKSTVAGYIRDLGVPTVSVDDLARDVFEDPTVQQELSEALAVRAPIERGAFRELLFAEPLARARANRVLHPRILAAMLAAPEPVMEVPLLIETCLWRHFDLVWVVTCGPEEQLRRLSERVGNESEARRMIASQLPSRAKCAFADRIVRTNSPPSNVRSFVNDALAHDLQDHLA